MIAVDTSALAAILFDEPDSDLYRETLISAQRKFIGAPTAFELRIVVKRRHGYSFVDRIDRLLRAAEMEIVSWTGDDLLLADEAMRQFSGRPVNLNYGDCMSYAMAKRLDVPLLYKGSDFAHTDIRSAL